MPIPVITKSTLALPTRALKIERPESTSDSRSRSFRQGANSASTANVTRMRISVRETPCRGTARRHKIQSLGGFRRHDLFCAMRRDIAVRFVPAHGALKSRGDRASLKGEFAFRARAIYKHHVLRDLNAFHWNLRLAANQPRKGCLCIGYTQCEAVRDFQ